MAQVVAVSRIEYGKGNGEVVTFNIGDEITGMKDEEILNLVAAGAVVEIGRNRKFTPEPQPGALAAADDDTRKRDELLVKANMAYEPEEGDTADVATVASATSPDANTGGEQTIGQSAAEAKADDKGKK